MMAVIQRSEALSSISDRNSTRPTSDKNRADGDRQGLDQIRSELRTHDEPLHRHRFDPARARIRKGQLDIGERMLGLGTEGRMQLCRQVGAPVHYLNQLDDSLANQCLNFHLERGDQTPIWPKDTPVDRRQLLAFACGEEFLGFGRADLTNLTGTDVLDAVVEAIEQHRLTDSVTGQLTMSADESWQLELVSTERAIEIRAGDVMEAGLRITHSPFGTSATTVQAYLLRLVCTNGLTHRECISRGTSRIRRLPAKERDAKEKVLSQIRRSSDSCLKGLQRKLESVHTLTEDRVAEGRSDEERQRNRQRFLNRLLSRVPRLRSRRLIELLAELWEEDDPTSYGAMNAMTFVATHNPTGRVAPGIRLALERLAGVMATRSIHICPQCYSMITD